MKRLFLLLIVIGTFCTHSFAQWEPKGMGIVPNGFFVSHIKAVSDSVVWAIAVDRQMWLNGPSPMHIPAVLRTTDGGDTWTMQQVPFSAGHLAISMSALDAHTMYYVTTNFMGVYILVYTTDGGSTWQSKNDADAAYGLGYGLHLFNDLEFASFGWGGYASYTTDGGDTWSVAPSPAMLTDESLFLVTGNDFMAVSGNHAWVPTSHGRIFRTTNKGQSWTVENSSFYPDRSISTMAFTDSLNGLAFSLWNAAGTAWLTPRLTSTIDGGLTWHTLNTPIDRFTNISPIPGLPGAYMGSTSSRLNAAPKTYLSLDHGQTWTDFDNPDGYEFGSLHFRSQNSGWASFAGAADATSPVAYKWTGFTSALPPAPNSANSLQLFPNPVSSEMAHIVFQAAEVAELHLSLTDATGRQVLQQQVRASAGTNKLALPVQQLPAGMYVVRLQNGQQVQHARLVVQP